MLKELIILFIASIELGTSSCSSNGHKLGYESYEDSIECESKVIDIDFDTITSIEILKDSNPTQLTEIYCNNMFSIRYPSNWEVIQENTQALDSTRIAVQIMQVGINDYDFRPNINVIVSKDKHPESTTSLAKSSFNQARKFGYATTLISVHDCQINGKKGSVSECYATLEGYKLHIYQYIVKKKDNSTFIITMTLDHKKIDDQKSISQRIINSIKIF